jgi:D-ribulokinase
MSALGRVSEPTAPGMADFHRSKREVYRLLRGFDHDSREAMRSFEMKSGRGRER